MKDMTMEQARAEAVRRWGSSGAIRLLPAPTRKGSPGTGRLARYRYIVANGPLRKRHSIEGQGDSWREAFADARPT